MIRLTDRLPETITVRKKRYKLKPDFRNVLLMMETLDSDEIIPEARTYRALLHVVRRPPKDDALCAEIMAEFRRVMMPETTGKTEGKRLTSFEQDADLIRGAFRQNYGIDLFRENLHWIEFSCLLACLPEGSRYTEIIGIRAKPMPKPTKYNAEERRSLAKAKAACALKISEKEREQHLQDSLSRTAASLIALANRGGKIGG